MKYAYLEENTKKLLGWYDDLIHSKIPTPNIEVKEEVWQEAVNINANCYEDGKFIAKDFRTANEIKQEAQARFRAERDKLLSEVDFYQLALVYNELTDIQKEELKIYRTELLDSTKTQTLPAKPNWFK